MVYARLYVSLELSYLPPKLSYLPPKPELLATRFKMRAELLATLHFFSFGSYVATKIQILLRFGEKLSFVYMLILPKFRDT